MEQTAARGATDKMGRGDACEERRTKLKAHSTINELPQQSVALEKYYNLAGQCQAKANAARRPYACRRARTSRRTGARCH